MAFSIVVALKRVYEPAEPSDGARVLVVAAHDLELSTAPVIRDALMRSTR